MNAAIHARDKISMRQKVSSKSVPFQIIDARCIPYDSCADSKRGNYDRKIEREKMRKESVELPPE